MENDTAKTVVETLAKEIDRLKVDNYIKDLQIEELKKKLAEAHGDERTGNDGKL